MKYILLFLIIIIYSCTASKPNNKDGIPMGWVKRNYTRIDDSTYRFSNNVYLLGKDGRFYFGYKCK
jgi:uncharacterized membrane protein